ncbi:MAG: hypothetical protein AAFP77_16115 [Bacteroidota bacterium]
MISYWGIQPYAEKNKLKEPTDLLQYPWDKVPEPVELTEEEIEARRKKIDRWDEEMRRRYAEQTAD